MNTVGIFAKYWQPGKVKTRLAATLGIDLAAEIHQMLFEHLAVTLRASADQRIIAASPPDQLCSIQSRVHQLCGESWQVTGQSEGNLGTRMKTFFREQFHKGSSKVVLIGSDCPWVQDATLELAFEKLDDAELVIGPADDGGYFLIGMRDGPKEIFEKIEWGSERVLEATRSQIRNSGYSCQELEASYDIDREEDLRRFLKLNESDPISPEAWKNLLRERLDNLLKCSQSSSSDLISKEPG